MIRKVVYTFALTVLTAGLLTGVASPGAQAAACVTIPAIAHRGGTEKYVENTSDAFRSASNVGVPWWETDVQFTSDNVPVIMHDDTVDRTTNGTGTVADLTYAELAALRTADDQPVPTLRQLINDAAVDGAKVMIELKTTPAEDQWAPLLAALGSRPIAPKLVITSFNGTTLVAFQAAAIKAHAPSYATGLIQDLGDQSVASVTQYGTRTLIKAHNSITASRVNAWVAGGLTVYSWTVDTVSEMERMSWYPKLAGVITNLPGGYLRWQRGRVC